MPEKKKNQRTAKGQRERKSASTRAGEFVRDRIPRGLREAIVSGARRVGVDLSPQMETRAPDVPEHPTPMERVMASSRRLRGEKEPSEPQATGARKRTSTRKAAPTRKAPTRKSATTRKAAGKRKAAGARKASTGERRGASSKRASSSQSKAATAPRKSSARKAKPPAKRASASKRRSAKTKSGNG